LSIKCDDQSQIKPLTDSIRKLANISELAFVDAKPENCFTFVVDNNEYYLPVSEEIDVEAEKEKIESEIKYLSGFIKSVDKKLSNERFVNNAPEQVVDLEKKKKSDAEAKIAALTNSLESL